MTPVEVPTPPACRRTITSLRPEGAATACLLSGAGTVLVSRYVGGFLTPGDELEFSSSLSASAAAEILITRSSRVHPKELYLAPIGYVTQPKLDKRQEAFLRAEVVGGGFGVRAVHLPARAVRDHFYRADRKRNWSDSPALYDLLRVGPSATLADLRLAYKVRRLELQAQGVQPPQFRNLERAFNLLMQPHIRSCYDALLLDPEAPVLFPYNGFGSLLVAGELAQDRQTFFAQNIISFVPDRRQRRFRAPLRRVDFLHDHAVYRDQRRKLEIVLDPILLPLAWDPTWNQWKHLLGAKIGIEASFVASGKYHLRSSEWELVSWLSALPSRIELSLPADLRGQVEAAKRSYHRFGQYFTALEQIRQRLLSEPLERRELDRLCSELGIPGDFDVAQISWKPDYDPFFYNQLRRRARKVYLFQSEYIMDLERAIVVEVPELGHATYVFAKPVDIDAFVRLYAKTSKEDIRKNRDGIAEHLGFLGRVTHGANYRNWLRDLKHRVGETVDYALALE